MSDPTEAALFTDLYELTMMQAYEEEGLTGLAVFDLYARTLPPQRNFLLAAGLAEAIDYLEHLSFTPQALDYLATLGTFTPAFLARLADFRFTGTVRAIPEGTPFFGGEPLLEVVAPLPQAQLVETWLLNQLTFQTLIASKGIRSVLAASGRPVIDFGQRRAHSIDAGVQAARALYLAGCTATSSVLAGQRYGIPVTGTMAHSYVLAHATEHQAFATFARRYPGTTLLVDTYDTVQGVRTAIEVNAGLPADSTIRAVRLDSGDFGTLSRQTRQLLDDAGLHDVRIVASGGLDEHAIARLVAAGAPIDSFAVGTRVSTSADAPTIDTVYKLVEYDGRGRAKFSADKATLPGRKQVFRETRDGIPVRDHLVGISETAPGTPLLIEVMREGVRLDAAGLTLDTARTRARDTVASLPRALRGLDAAATPYPVEISPALIAQRDSLRP